MISKRYSSYGLHLAKINNRSGIALIELSTIKNTTEALNIDMVVVRENHITPKSPQIMVD